jgi:predicted amidophosphoribosyltransferase
LLATISFTRIDAKKMNMSPEKCPVCGAPRPTEEDVCARCSWNFSPVPTSDPRRLEDRLKQAQRVWHAATAWYTAENEHAREVKQQGIWWTDSAMRESDAGGAKCPVCGLPQTEEEDICTRCSWDFSPVLTSDPRRLKERLQQAQEVWQAFVAWHTAEEERARAAQKAGRQAPWFRHAYTLKYQVESICPRFGKDEPALVVRITTPFVPDFPLPETVLVGLGDRLPVSRGDGEALHRWSPTRVGAQGVELRVPLTILKDRDWYLRLFFADERQAAKIRLMHPAAGIISVPVKSPNLR